MMLRYNKKGFTMIELLMVIMLVAILGAVALPQFLDFRTEGRRAATTGIVSAVRSGIKLQYSQMVLRCEVNGGNTWPTIEAVQRNDITSGARTDNTDGTAYTCTATQIPAGQQRFIDSNVFPGNPFRADDNRVIPCDSGDRAATLGNTAGWCYDDETGDFWANSDTVSEYLD
jgi:prepilin-type N-terminal cleavage/methylation domain-containing protein